MFRIEQNLFKKEKEHSLKHKRQNKSVVSSEHLNGEECKHKKTKKMDNCPGIIVRPLVS